MAKAQHIKPTSSFELPSDETQELEGLSKTGDYSVLSKALLKKGEFCLLHGDISGLRFFDMAIKLDPANSNLFYEQGLALFEYGSEDGKEEELILAGKSFKRATRLNPNCFEAWHAWGNTLYLLGIRKNEPSYFQHARKKYDKALTLIADQSQDVLADLYWDLGDLWKKLAEISGEATDLNLALKAYEKATLYQDDFSGEFWTNFGDVYFNLGEKTNDLRLHVKAINCYKNSISITISSHMGWLRLADALKEIYSYTHDEDHYSQASECYSAAAQLCPNDEQLWTRWAELLLESGLHFRDIKKLRSCVEKCHRGHQCNPEAVQLVGIWSEALAHLGLFTEKLELLHEAQNKIEELSEEIPDDPSVYYSYGMCLMATAAYFNDVDFYYQAIEKFQEGLSLNRSLHRLWYGIAIAHVAAAEIDQDDRNFERACRFFERALNLKVNSTYHYNFGYCLLKFSDLNHDQETVERAVFHFEKAISMQKNVAYQHPEWLYHYAISLDYLGEYNENDNSYVKALDILNHILMLSPEFPHIHSQLALTYSHYAELINEPDIYKRAFHHYRIAHQRDKENDQIILDWGITLVNLAELLENSVESEEHYRDAEYKMIQAARLGNPHAYFSLACLYSLLGDYDRSICFLEKAHAFEGLPPIEEVLEDEWLEGVRETEAFSHFIEKIESNVQE